MPNRKDHTQSFKYFRDKGRYVRPISSSSLKDLNKKLNQAVEDLGKEFLQDLADTILADAQSRLTGDKKLENSTDPEFGGAFDTGRLHASGDWKQINDETIEVGFEADYAPDVEFGLDPSQVDATLQEITAWAKRKRLTDYKSAGFLIHRSIHRIGIMPKPYLRSAIAWARARIVKIAFQTEKRLKIR